MLPTVEPWFTTFLFTVLLLLTDYQCAGVDCVPGHCGQEDGIHSELQSSTVPSFCTGRCSYLSGLFVQCKGSLPTPAIWGTYCTCIRTYCILSNTCSCGWSHKSEKCKSCSWKFGATQYLHWQLTCHWYRVGNICTYMYIGTYSVCLFQTRMGNLVHVHTCMYMRHTHTHVLTLGLHLQFAQCVCVCSLVSHCTYVLMCIPV